MQTAQVILNVGGSVYCTTASTLCNAPFFKGLFDFEANTRTPLKEEEKKNLFVDRDGPEFAPILSFLRTGEFICPKNLDIRAVLREADYYGVVIPLSEAIESKRIPWLDDEWLKDKARADDWNAIGEVGDKLLKLLLIEFRACANTQRSPCFSVCIDKDSFIKSCRAETPKSKIFNEFRLREASAAYDNDAVSIGSIVNTEFFEFISDHQRELISYCAWHKLSLSIIASSHVLFSRAVPWRHDVYHNLDE